MQNVVAGKHMDVVLGHGGLQAQWARPANVHDRDAQRGGGSPLQRGWRPTITKHFCPSWGLRRQGQQFILDQTSSQPPSRVKLTLHKTAQNPAPRLQKRMADDNLQKPLESLSALLNNRIVKLVEVDLAR